MLKLTAALFWLDGGMCSQNPAHSFWIAGRPLPLCARDLGLFGGFLLACAVLLSLRRTLAWQPLWLLGLMPLAVDGLASFAGLEPSSNALRLATGLLAGASLALLVAPLLGRAEAPAARIVRGQTPRAGRVARVMRSQARTAMGTALVLAVLVANGQLYAAVGLAGTAGVLALAASANRLARLPWAAAAALALPELAALAAAKHVALLALG